MLKILGVNNGIVTARWQDEDDSKSFTFPLSDCLENAEGFLMAPELPRYKNVRYGFKMWGDANVQNLWKSYLKSNKSKLDDLTSKKSIASNLTEDDKIAAIIADECTKNKASFKLA